MKLKRTMLINRRFRRAAFCLRLLFFFVFSACSSIASGEIDVCSGRAVIISGTNGGINTNNHPNPCSSTDPHSQYGICTDDGASGTGTDGANGVGDAFKSPNVYINGLPPHYPEDHLFELCSGFGEIRSVRSFTRHVGEKESGYGFVL